jgi:hypothetical protein
MEDRELTVKERINFIVKTISSLNDYEKLFELNEISSLEQKQIAVLCKAKEQLFSEGLIACENGIYYV